MNSQISSYNISKIVAAYLFNIGILLGLSTVAFGLISCGGGGGAGGTSGSSSGAMSVSSFNPPGIVASSVYQTILISGSNFADGTTISITGSSGVTAVSSVVVTNSSTLTAVIKIGLPAPTNRYVTVSVQPPASAAAVTQVLGVASVYKTYVNILASTYFQTCTGCHNNTVNGGLDLASANNLNNEPSQGCSSRFRVKRGDPRRSSSFLIDKIQATSAVGNTPCYGNPMPNAGPLMASEIQEIVEWVAGGAH